MRWSEAVEVIDVLEAEGCRLWVAGGFGLDLLVGRLTRPHRDLDLLIDAEGYDVAMAVLGRLGYAVETDWLPVRIEVAAPGDRWVDVHPVVFDAAGLGLQGDPAGVHFRYGPESFAVGLLEGRRVGCLSVEQQWAFHQGYEPRPQDVLDLQLLAGLRSGVRP